MKNRLTAILIAVAISLSLVACGSETIIGKHHWGESRKKTEGIGDGSVYGFMPTNTEYGYNSKGGLRAVIYYFDFDNQESAQEIFDDLRDEIEKKLNMEPSIEDERRVVQWAQVDDCDITLMNFLNSVKLSVQKIG